MSDWSIDGEAGTVTHENGFSVLMSGEEAVNIEVIPSGISKKNLRLLVCQAEKVWRARGKEGSSVVPPASPRKPPVIRIKRRKLGIARNK